MARLAVAVSGGADSLFALMSLRAQGHEVFALHGRFLPPHQSGEDAPPTDPVPALQEVCTSLGIPLHVLDLTQHFDQQVIAPFVQTYAAGQTPNPCALCNARIKFGLLLDAAQELGAEGIATGHYAHCYDHPRYGRVLAQGADSAKDQSYFLALVPAARLALAHFPLAHVTKKDAVAALAAQGIAVPLPRESQEICFVPADRYRPFLEEQAHARGVTLGRPGPMLLHAGTTDETIVAQHKGLWQYTEGQRKGLGVAWREPLFVIGKDDGRNSLLLGTKDDLGMQGCTAEEVNFLVLPSLWPEALRGRVRYRQQAAPVEVSTQVGTQVGAQVGAQVGPQVGICEESSTMTLRFVEAQSPTAPGQVAVIYDTDGVVLAGGIIAPPR